VRRIEGNDDEQYLFMVLRIGYCYVQCVEQNAWIHFLDYTRPVRYFRSAWVYLLLLFVGKIRGQGKTSLHCS